MESLKRTVSAIVLTCIIIGILSVGFHFQPLRVRAQLETVTYDYYVVAGYEMVPTPPAPAPDPAGFDVTFYSSYNGTGVYTPASVYDFGNITKWGGRSYLYHGVESAPGPMGAAVDIQNLLGFDIIILDLTVEVTASTPIPDYTRNSSMVLIDTLDPWDEASGRYDECNYLGGNGSVVVKRMPDMTTGGVPLDQFCLKHRDPAPYPDGPGSLVEPDKDGDAGATGHVAPIALANGSTFTEYFGVIISGRPEEGTQINGTITLAITYDYKVPPTFLSAEPSYIEPELGETFSVSVTATNFTEFWSFEFTLWYDSTLITATKVFSGPVVTDRPDYNETVNNLTVPGRVWYGGNLNTGPPLNISDTETLAIINFTALALGTSTLHINETLLGDPLGQPIEHEVFPPVRFQAIVTVVPEFPSFLILPLFMTATLLVAIFLNRRKHPLAHGKRIE